MYDIDEEIEEEEELEPRVKYSIILEKDDYESEEEEDPVPYSEKDSFFLIIK